jgi:perosamine synthetase
MRRIRARLAANNRLVSQSGEPAARQNGTVRHLRIETSIDVRAVVDAIARVVQGAERPVHLHEPWFRGREWDYVKQCLDTGWVSSAGRFVEEFESRLATACGTKSAVAMVNGTTALQMALRLAGVGPGDEVVMPSLTFVATANAVSHCGAVPHFVDADERTLGLDAHKLTVHLERVASRRGDVLINRETARPIRAVVPVHVFGHPADMDPLATACGAFDLPIVEDATESLGSTYRGRPCGGLGHLGVLSFNGNKIITTGGGGALLTNDEALARRATHLTSMAKLPHKWAVVHDDIGWNYRMPNINAALGFAQIEALEDFVAAKRALARRYADAFAEVHGARWVEEPPGASSNYWLNAILLDDDTGAARDAVLSATHEAGFLTRPVWTLMHRLAMYRHHPRGDLSVSESLERRLVNLPSSAILGMNAG